MSIGLTEAAADRVKSQLAERGAGVGLRVGVKKSGCNGYRYTMDYADEIGPEEQVYESHGAKLVVSEQDLVVLDGTTLDFKREGLNSMFRFDNPQAEHSCGCGESFNVS